MSNARLAVLPATTHYNIFYSPTLALTATPYLDAPMPDERPVEGAFHRNCRY